jgi:hypothetical protein
MFGWEAQLVEGFDPATSFGPEVSRRYDDHLRGDEAETVDFLAALADADVDPSTAGSSCTVT